MSSKLKKNVILVAVGSFSSKILVFLLVPFYTSLLSSSEYGTMDLIFISVSLLAPFFSCVIYEAMFRFLLDRKYNNKEVIATGILVNIIGFLIVLLFSTTLFLLPNIKELYGYILLYYISYTMYENLQYILRGLEKMSLFSIAGVISTIMTILLNVIFLLWLDMGVKGYLLAHIGSRLFVSIVVIIWGRIYRYITMPKKKHVVVLKEMLKYSLPLMPNAVSWWVANSSDKFILTYFHGTGASGLYAVSYKIPSIANAFGTIFNSAWQITAIDYYDSEETGKKFGKTYELYFAFQSIMCVGLIMLTKLIATVMFQKEFFEAWKFVPILCVASFFHGLGEFLGAIYISSKKTNVIFYTTLTAALTNVLLNLLLIPQFGGYGAAIATMISYFVVFFIRFIHGRRIIKFPIYSCQSIICIGLMLLSMVAMCLQVKASGWLCGIVVVLILVLQRRSVIQLVRSVLKTS